ncbi:hypothetical protein [Saccharothrix obliqua]|uniref:hypothetical protein n=1 Tax=Saccharothrix obliqua TaxID=2861747 RepID=UPI001C5FC187|nr:hypothetical protein [Saccharothrix obliqua]MBW4720269.1 hypothetical protein [Saccharothrix obliqua]
MVRPVSPRVSTPPLPINPPPTTKRQDFRIDNPTVQRIGPARTAAAGPSSAPVPDPGPPSPEPATTDQHTDQEHTAPVDAEQFIRDLRPAELDNLARRLFEPIARLLRAELRGGRERAGRLHDRRR